MQLHYCTKRKKRYCAVISSEIIPKDGTTNAKSVKDPASAGSRNSIFLLPDQHRVCNESIQLFLLFLVGQVRRDQQLLPEAEGLPLTETLGRSVVHCDYICGHCLIIYQEPEIRIGIGQDLDLAILFCR